MITAERKKKENIVEYLIYMWHVENIIRVCDFDMEKIRAHMVSHCDEGAEVRERICAWYAGLADGMRAEGVTERGHLQCLVEVQERLERLHGRLAGSAEEAAYAAAYGEVRAFVDGLRGRAGVEAPGVVETCISALYGYLVRRLRGLEPEGEAVEGVVLVNRMLTVLAERYEEFPDV